MPLTLHSIRKKDAQPNKLPLGLTSLDVLDETANEWLAHYSLRLVLGQQGYFPSQVQRKEFSHISLGTESDGALSAIATFYNEHDPDQNPFTYIGKLLGNPNSSEEDKAYQMIHNHISMAVDFGNPRPFVLRSKGHLNEHYFNVGVQLGHSLGILYAFMPQDDYCVHMYNPTPKVETFPLIAKQVASRPKTLEQITS